MDRNSSCSTFTLPRADAWLAGMKRIGELSLADGNCSVIVPVSRVNAIASIVSGTFHCRRLPKLTKARHPDLFMCSGPFAGRLEPVKMASHTELLHALRRGTGQCKVEVVSQAEERSRRPTGGVRIWRIRAPVHRRKEIEERR